MDSTSTPKRRLLSLRARPNSLMHQREPSQLREIRNSTASQRDAASLRARSQRSPATMPRPGSRSRKTSFQPSPASQSRIATASALLSLEWLKNKRDIEALCRSDCQSNQARPNRDQNVPAIASHG